MPSPSSTPAAGPLTPFLREADGGRGARRARFAVRPARPAALPDVDGLLAGAIAVDITPPPGMPKAGYSANAHSGTGFRTRLRAHVLHLRAGTSSIALVQCDLLGGSAVVQHLVARAVAETTDVPLAGLFIGATHTHAGPGQFLGTDFYNRFASNKAGFDPDFTAFLVDRIADGITTAVADRTPARLAVGSADVWGLTRNRSLTAHVRNDGADPSLAPHRKFHAVNPALHLIRVDTDDRGPLAAMVIFSVHGTGVPVQATEYNADLWGYVCGELRRRVEDDAGHPVVVGAMQGTHADVAPAIRPGAAGHLEAARVGRALGAEAHRLHRSLADALTGEVTLAAGLREVDLDRNANIDGTTLPRRPAVGAALLAGAHENVTPVIHRIPPFAPGHPKHRGRTAEQGAKWIVGSRWGQPLVIPLRQFPRVLPVQVLRIADDVIVGLPFEVTVEAGREIEAQVRVELPDIGRVIVSSVANEYSGYVATAAEYEEQNYEGAHTLYGPRTAAFLARHAARLASEVQPDAPVQDVLTERHFDLRIHRYLATRGDGDPTRSFVGGPTYVDPTATTDGYWRAEWIDVVPGSLAWHEPLVRVDGDDGPLADDQSWDLQVSLLETTADQARYEVRWFDPPFHGTRRQRFVLLANATRPELTSDPFG
jgi:neutral ceramidase